MESDEAVSRNKPQHTNSDSKIKKNNSSVYFLAVFILFVLLMWLCVNNLTVYKYYNDDREMIIDTFKRVQDLNNEQLSLSVSKQQTDQENLILKNRFNEISIQNQEIMQQMQEIKRQNDELIKKNRELIDDNVALQNSIKMAASVGIKPQSYTEFGGISSRGNLDRGKYAGLFIGTAYTPSIEECGSNSGITNSGMPIIPGISIAIDQKYWPFGTVFYIKGLGYAVAMDTGSKIKGKNRFDFAVFDKDFANILGTRKWPVYVVKLGTGEVKDIAF